jgi:polyisoprenoid-binding protein YceI
MIRRTTGMTLAALLLPILVLGAQAKPATKPTAKKPPAVAAPVRVPMRFRLGATGNEARYRVRELLAAATVENDAVGTTAALTGGLVINAAGKIDTAASKWTVDLTTLKSDRSMRDRYIQGRSLETAQFPTAVLVVTDIKGLPAVLPDSGTLTLTLLGNFTAHGVMKASTWEVTATVSGDHVSGTATTHFKFGDFNMTQPRVPAVASVVDDIKIEYDFHLIRERE